MIDSLAIARQERDSTAAELASAEAAAAELRGAARYTAELRATALRGKLVTNEATVARLTVDPIKRLRRGLASLDEIRDRLDEVVFADGAGAVWFGMNVSAGNDPNLLEALSIAITRLSRTDNAAAMNYARWRSSQVPHDPANRTLVW
jgi:hypothetical protein